MLITLVLSVSCASAQTPFEAGNMAISLDAQAGNIRCASAFDPGLISALRVYLYDGVAGEQVAITPAAIAADNGMSLNFATDMPLDLTASITRLNESVLVALTARNTGATQQLLELGIEAAVPSSEDISVFDGRSVADQPTEEFGEDKFMGRLNLCALWNDRASFGMGLAATELRSWFHHLYVPAADGAVLRTVTRLVLDPGQADTVAFFLASRPGEWGYREILEAYYATWPEMFLPSPGVDARVSLGGAEYQAWRADDTVVSAEICRRLYGGWDWCYAPFRRTGDIYGREELWDYESARPIANERAQSREDFYQWRREHFDKSVRTDVAMMFYVPSQVWCEDKLALERYSDALVEDPDIKTVFLTPWVTGHDNERLMFPYNTSFAEQSHIDMAQVLAELTMQGFAFDTAEGGGKYRGPALSRVDGRAWDDSGPYCRNNVAVARLMQFVHTLTTRDGQVAGVVANTHPTGSYSSPLYADSIMLEGEPWKISRDYPNALRWMSGRKTIVFWEGYGLNDFIDVAKARPEQIRMAIRGLADFTLMQSLRNGIIPPPAYTKGVERLVQWLPTIVECVHAGWQPVPATRVPDPCWVTRYGDGLGTLIAIAHETAGEVEAEVAIENERIADGALLFTTSDGGEVLNTVYRGETIVNLDVPSRTPILLRAQALVVPAVAVQSAAITSTLGSDGGELRMTLHGQGRVEIPIRIPTDMVISEVTVNGQTPRIAGERLTMLALELRGESEIVVRFASTWLQCEEPQLLDFPFATATISIPEGASDAVRLSAERLQGYFTYWHKHVLADSDYAEMPVIEGAVTDRPAVLVRLADGPASVRCSGEQLLIGAPDEEALSALTLKLLGALDLRYFTAVPAGPYAGAAELPGGILRWDEKP